ncbi:MAG: hypothetical protein GX458_02165 [Phyllobacteriaceae bacterium]|nr:hypothetical protein [Phyllobacteriaceae bacterium]
MCLTVASLLVGFAHRPLPGFSTGEDLVAAGGISFGSVCVARVVVEDHGGKPTTRVAITVCDACLLAAAPGLGAVAEIVPPPPIDLPLGRLVFGDERGRGRDAPTATARGPPALG